MSLDHQLIIKPATEAQAREATIREAGYWGARAEVSVEDYLKLSTIFQQGAFAQDGRVGIWVLAPKDDPDTTSFFASCQVYTREVLTLQPGQALPSSSFGHAITSVFVPPEHRGKGYAKRLMSLLHSVLAPHQYPNHLKTPTVTDRPSTVSVLYSAVGDYYSRCIPSTGESGWSLQKSFITTWPLLSVQISQGVSPRVELLSESGVIETLNADDPNISTDLLEFQRKDPTKTYFAFVPTAPLNAFSTTIGKLLLHRSQGPSNSPWGAKITGTNEFMVWVYYGLPKLELVVTRLRATAHSFPVLLNAARQAAKDTNCNSIVVWNIPENLKEIARATGGETTEREDDLSAFKWYGQGPGMKVDNAGVVWVLDER
ncbi:unnamed protein product [Rhizoctonia solani]|uniref:N-acetyltransferase domain-containing protein n=1 Tax=Rhizoctonia solani TaxID=456999 RepID=A0A8H3AE41_9AGAM|nr:unnamed protein product [Rhizoctonia solani]